MDELDKLLYELATLQIKFKESEVAYHKAESDFGNAYKEFEDCQKEVRAALDKRKTAFMEKIHAER